MQAHLVLAGHLEETVGRSRRHKVWSSLLLSWSVAAEAALAGGCGELPDVVVEFEGAAITGEDGSSAQVGIALTQAPKGVLYVRAVSSDTTEGRVSQPLRIDGSNWEVAQSISVTGVDDNEPDGDVAYEVSVEVRRAFGGWREVGRATFHNRDDDSAIFHRLGDLPGGDSASYVMDVSANGEVVVGYSAGELADQAVRWTVVAGLTALHPLFSRANGVSPDGTNITGLITVEGDQRSWAVGVLWRGNEAAEILDPFEPDPTSKLYWFAEGKVVFDDGLVYGRCQSRSSYGEPIACRVDPGELATRLPSEYSYSSLVNDADEAGHFVGTFLPSHGELGRFKAYAMYDGANVALPGGYGCEITPGNCQAAAFALVQGDKIVGTVSLPSSAPERAFIADPQHMTLLADLAGGAESGAAYAISEDARVVGGVGETVSGKEAVLWIDGQPRSLAALVHEAGGVIPDGFSLLEVRAMARDGRTLVGNGRNEQGNPEGFHVELPRLPD